MSQDARPLLHITASRDDLVDQAAYRIADIMAASIRQTGACHLALAGGRTPRPVYERLASPAVSSTIDWDRVHVYFGDERCVPHDHPDSNYRMARHALLDRVPIPRNQVFPMPARLTRLWVGVRDYTQVLWDKLAASASGLPQLDLVLLGLGDDGHTASLFPDTCILADKRAVAAVYVPKLKTWRMSLTLPTLNASRHVLFLVSGADKREAVARVLEDASPPLPARRIQPDGVLEWYLDAEAAP